MLIKEIINQDNYIPTPPTPEGVWKDKSRDHDFFQKNVSLAAQLGGVSASSGCMHISAQRARETAEARYWKSQIKIPKTLMIETPSKQIFVDNKF